jgi:hypothetical protein
MQYEEAKKQLEKIDREDYLDIYYIIGDSMFSTCYVPNVADFANAFGKKTGKTKEAQRKIEQITSFTGNYQDIVNSVKRRDAKYTEAESAKFMNSVIAANVSDITESGYFYKKLISSCDNMYIDLKYEDCKSNGEEIQLPIDKTTYNYKIKHRFIIEIDKYTETYEEFLIEIKDLESIHIRTFLTCKRSRDHRTFCKKCAGLFKREHYSSFIPEYIGIYSTLMITEHATQSSLDSMNKGTSEKVNVLLEQRIHRDETKTYEDVKNKINEIIDDIGFIGVESRFYEIALLSRMYKQKDNTWLTAPLVTSFLRQGDEFGSFIYRPSKDTFRKMLSADKIKVSSVKSKIAFDEYD